MNYRFSREPDRGIFSPILVSTAVHIVLALVIVFFFYKESPEVEEDVLESTETSLEVSVVIETERVADDNGSTVQAEEGLFDEVYASQDNSNLIDDEAQPISPINDVTHQEQQDDIESTQVAESSEKTPPEPPTEENSPPEQVPVTEPSSLDDQMNEEAIAEVAPVDELIRTPTEDMVASENSRSMPSPQSSQNAYDAIFAQKDAEVSNTKAKSEKSNKKLLSSWKAREDAMRGTLKNFQLRVQPGNHTGVGAPPAEYSWYIEKLHDVIHVRWALTYLQSLTDNHPVSHPLNRLSLNTTLEIVIHAQSGGVEEVNIVRTSGETMFDMEAVLVAQSLGLHRNAPAEIVSPNGKIYLHWNFWRDHQQCNTGGVTVFLVHDS